MNRISVFDIKRSLDGSLKQKRPKIGTKIGNLYDKLLSGDIIHCSELLNSSSAVYLQESYGLSFFRQAVGYYQLFTE